jgi:quinolinate synthase
MGRNLQQLLGSLAEMPDAAVAALHPSHTAASVRAALPRLHAYPHGTCIVHHIFGGETCDAVRRGYGDAYITAHFEVPGEMFTLAMEAAAQRDMGVVGSTSDILKFISEKVEAAVQRGFSDRLQFVLGTESGMVTSIVRAVQVCGGSWFELGAGFCGGFVVSKTRAVPKNVRVFREACIVLCQIPRRLQSKLFRNTRPSTFA